MKTIGFNFTSSSFYYLVLEGTLADPVFVLKNRISLPENHDVL